MRERPVMSDQQRGRLAVACLENALNLIRHSEVLLASGAIPYAQFLAGSAWEEILKARYCIEEGGTWKTWWDGFYDHKTKLNLARRYWQTYLRTRRGHRSTSESDAYTSMSTQTETHKHPRDWSIQVA